MCLGKHITVPRRLNICVIVMETVMRYLAYQLVGHVRAIASLDGFYERTFGSGIRIGVAQKVNSSRRSPGFQILRI
jgi:hypothetical protein